MLRSIAFFGTLIDELSSQCRFAGLHCLELESGFNLQASGWSQESNQQPPCYNKNKQVHCKWPFFSCRIEGSRVKFQSFLSQGYWSCFLHWGNVLCFSLLWRSQLHDEGQVHPQFLMGNAFESQDVISSCQAVQQHGIALRYGSEEIRWTLSGNNWVFVKHKAAVTKTEISTSPWNFIWPRFWSGFGICRGGYPKNWTKNRWSWHMRITFLEFWGFSL